MKRKDETHEEYREREQTRNMAYYAAHREELKIKQAVYRAAHREARSSYHAAYRQKQLEFYNGDGLVKLFNARPDPGVDHGPGERAAVAQEGSGA